jgi:DNA-binding NarL/FixJ family response regulator
MSTIKVAIVDDHNLFREGLYSLLSSNESLELIINVGNGQEFFEKLNQGLTPDIVLLDLTMPEMDGFEVLKLLQKQFPKVKSIALSMHDDGNYVVKCLKSGAMGYLLKNTDEQELFRAIEMVYRGEKYYNQEITNTIINTMSESGPKTQKLSPKEEEILALIAEGKTTKQIAYQLFISTRTVETHRVNIMKKLNAKNTAEMIKIAAKLDLLS